MPATPPSIYDRDNLMGVGDNARGTSSLGNFILRGASLVNWRGSAAQEVEGLWARTEALRTEAAANGGAKDDASAAAAQLQRGWERNTLLSLYFGPSPASLVEPTLRPASEPGRPYDRGDVQLLDDIAEALVGIKII